MEETIKCGLCEEEFEIEYLIEIDEDSDGYVNCPNCGELIIYDPQF